MSGSAGQIGRKELLERSRLERAARQTQKQKEIAAQQIQAFYRGRRSKKREQRRVREAQRASLESSLDGKVPLSGAQLVVLLRQFLFYYSPKTDSVLLLKLAKLLCVSLATDDGYHAHLFHGSAEMLGIWGAQMRKVCLYLTRLLDEVRSNDGISTIVFALWLCLDAKSWPWVKKESSPQVGQTINERQMDVFFYLANRDMYPRLATAIHRLTCGLISPPVAVHLPSSSSSSSTVSDSSSVVPKPFALSVSDKNTLARLIAIALRPSSSSPSSSSSSSVSSSSSSSSSSSFFASERKSAAESEDKVWVLVASHIFSVPLLATRFANGGLSTITQTLQKPAIFNKICNAVIDHGASLPKNIRAWEGLEPASQNSCYLLGNLVELGTSSPGPYQTNYLNALRLLLQSLPPHALPQDSSGVLMHPLLKSQLLLLRHRDFLHSVARTLEKGPTGDAQIVTMLLLALLNKWADASNTDVLNTLVFSTNAVTALWKLLVDQGVLRMFRGDEQFDTRTLSQVSEMVSLFCLCYAHLLFILDDQEFFVNEHPFPLREVAHMVEFFKLLLLQYYWKDTSQRVALTAQELDSDEEEEVEGKRAPKIAPNQLQSCLTRVFLNLRDRYARKPFCPPDVWLMQIPVTVFQEELSRGTDRAVQLLQNIPFVLPFDARVQIFYRNIAADQEEWKEGGLEFDHGRGVHAVIRRNNILVDGFEKLFGLGNRLKGRVQITFIDENGMQEAGIDGGGLFKEFLTVLLKDALHPDRGLFRSTADNSLCPNPDSSLILDRGEHLQMFQFLGRIVGKALYDGIQIEPQFANFFLRECLGRTNTADELVCLDPELYKHLMFLKTYEGNIEDLALNFSLNRVSLGETTEIDLIPNGRNIPVTRENRLQFVMYMADYRLNKETKPQSRAFVAGMHDIINLEWLRMFSSDELSLLISGAPHIDLEDLRRNTNYANGYSDSHELIKWFWEVLKSFDAPTQADFLRFATSCPRAPLLGFKALYPKFCIQHMNAGPDQAMLPTSSTCMNLFRLPRYFSKEQLRGKLLYAIKAGTGFGLT